MLTDATQADALTHTASGTTSETVTGATTAITEGSSHYVPVTTNAQATTSPEDAYTQEERQQLEKQLEPVSAISTAHKGYFARGLKKFLNLFRRNGEDKALHPTHLEARPSGVTGTVTDVTLNADQYISIYNDGSMAREPQVSLDSDLLAVISIEGDTQEFFDRYHVNITDENGMPYTGQGNPYLTIESRLNKGKVIGTVIGGVAAIAAPVLGFTVGPSGAAAALAPVAFGANTNSESGPNRN
jgi:hypothetical protein